MPPDLPTIAEQLRWEASQLRATGVLAVRPIAERLEALAEQYESKPPPRPLKFFRFFRSPTTGNA
jgi:hypothetical protein